jgi:CHASE1-domain containing sensor protein
LALVLAPLGASCILGSPMPVDASQSSTRSRGSHRVLDWGLPVLVLLLGALLSFAFFVAIRAKVRAARRADFEHQAARLAGTAEDSFDTPLEVLRSIPAFFEASDQVTRAEFRAFVGHALGRYPWIYALEWIPRVPGAERAAYEAAAVADGLAGYHFKQDAPPGLPVRATERTEYFPLYYMEPPNRVALGIEETAMPARKAALERARDLGATAISERLNLVQDDPKVASVIAFHPIYRHGERPGDLRTRRESLRGLAAAVFRIGPVLAASLHGQDLQNFDLALVDADARPPSMLYQSHPGTLAAQAAEVTWEHAATIGGRRWMFRVGDRAGLVRARDAGWSVFAIGLLVSGLCAALVYVLRSARRLRRQVVAAQKLGQYTLAEKLGEGGMGAVYRAHHAVLRRPTAIKLLDPARSNPTTMARFESEVRLTSALAHPNTVIVHDYGHTPDGVFYYAMELIDGITLQALVDADGPQPPQRVVHILVQVCAALAEAHGIGLVHRDVKPSNIMLCNRGGIPDFVKVLDFGLAKDLSARKDPQLSQSVTLVGTPLYVAPELVLNQTAIDGRVDLYAVGAVAYFLLTGTPVFGGTTTFEVCAKHLSITPDLPSQRLGKPLPPELEALVMQCLAKEPAARPFSAEELGQRLGGLADGSWDQVRARAWWRERGSAIENAVRAAREGAVGPRHERTLEIDRRRHA